MEPLRGPRLVTAPPRGWPRTGKTTGTGLRPCVTPTEGGGEGVFPQGWCGRRVRWPPGPHLATGRGAVVVPGVAGGGRTTGPAAGAGRRAGAGSAPIGRPRESVTGRGGVCPVESRERGRRWGSGK